MVKTQMICSNKGLMPQNEGSSQIYFYQLKVYSQLQVYNQLRGLLAHQCSKTVALVTHHFVLLW